MSICRRDLLKGLVAATTATAAGSSNVYGATQYEEGAAMLYDATRCIGCKACVVACKEANRLPSEHTDVDRLYDDPIDLSSSTKTLIKLYKEGDDYAFVKRQCMHCIKPACVSVCIIGALHKTESGIVAYDPSRCIGCRYCMVACPFGIPRFEWDTPTPQIVKCEMCRELQEEGKQPACCEVCPRDAVVFGSRSALLADAKKRIADNPDAYIDHVYGELEGGGTQVLYLSAFPFEKLGLPPLTDEAVPSLSEAVQHGIYRGFIAPAVLYAALAAVLIKNRNKARASEGGES